MRYFGLTGQLLSSNLMMNFSLMRVGTLKDTCHFKPKAAEWLQIEISWMELWESINWDIDSQSSLKSPQFWLTGWLDILFFQIFPEIINERQLGRLLVVVVPWSSLIESKASLFAALINWHLKTSTGRLVNVDCFELWKTTGVEAEKERLMRPVMMMDLGIWLDLEIEFSPCLKTLLPVLERHLGEWSSASVLFSIVFLLDERQ